MRLSRYTSIPWPIITSTGVVASCKAPDWEDFTSSFCLVSSLGSWREKLAKEVLEYQNFGWKFLFTTPSTGNSQFCRVRYLFMIVHLNILVVFFKYNSKYISIFIKLWPWLLLLFCLRRAQYLPKLVLVIFSSYSPKSHISPTENLDSTSPAQGREWTSVPRLWRSHNPRLLACSQSGALSRACLSAQQKIPVKSKLESHHMKIIVVKERKGNGNLI